MIFKAVRTTKSTNAVKTPAKEKWWWFQSWKNRPTLKYIFHSTIYARRYKYKLILICIFVTLYQFKRNKVCFNWVNKHRSYLTRHLTAMCQFVREDEEWYNNTGKLNRIIMVNPFSRMSLASFVILTLIVTTISSRELQPKPPITAPAVLSDPKYGTHKFATVNVRTLHSEFFIN